MRIRETMQAIDNDGKVVKQRKKYIGECPYQEVFDGAMDGLEKKMKQYHLGRMNMVDRIVNEKNKVVFKISMVLKFECDQLWTYEWVD